jgi:hypothetical protein
MEVVVQLARAFTVLLPVTTGGPGMSAVRDVTATPVVTARIEGEIDWP